MELISILLIVLVIGVAVLLILILKKGKGHSEEKLAIMLEKLSSLSTSQQDLRVEIDKKLSETHKITESQFGNTRQIISDVTEKLTKLDETNKQVVDFSKQLKNLQDILKNPKQRGVLGEYFLEQTLKNVLPPNSYQMQYEFKNKDIVDAVVFVKDKIIPVDSKFSLENYERILNADNPAEREKLEKQFKDDLKLRINETAKYVRPEEGTLDFAFMFIPSEAIYYDLLINKVGAVKVNTRDLIEYAFMDKKVIIVSPTSFLAYLQTVLQGLRAMKIEESAKEIKQNVEKLGKHILSYESFLKKTGASLSTTVNHYNSAYQEFRKIDKDVIKITDGEQKVEPTILDRPKLDE